jgi:ribosome-binding protein aMBF1 (putative translation factor)
MRNPVFDDSPTPGITERFRPRIERLRRAKGWTLRETARRAGIDHTYLSKIENGKVPLPAQKTRAAIMTALGKGCRHRCEIHR